MISCTGLPTEGSGGADTGLPSDSLSVAPVENNGNRAVGSIAI